MCFISELFLTLSLILVLNFGPSTTSDYFEYKRKFRPCAEIQYGISSSRDDNDWRLESVPPGYTFFTLSPINLSYRVKSVENLCSTKHCHDGGIQQLCQNITEGDTVNFENNSNETLICTCETDVSASYKETVFDRRFTGTVFSPYVKNWEEPNAQGSSGISKWNNYTLEEIKQLVAIVATRFTRFSTYGIGATSTSRSWSGGDSTGLVPMATAQINTILHAKGLPTLKILQGIYQNDYADIQNQEVYNAFEAAYDANTVFPGTVHGIIVTSDYVTNNETVEEVCDIIDRHKRRRAESQLKIGIRLKSCTQIIPTKLPEADNNLHSVPPNYTYAPLLKSPEIESIYKKLLDRVDFIVCSNSPPAFLVDQPIPTVVAQYGATFLKIKDILKQVNPNLTIIAQGGWGTFGVSGNGAMNNVSNMVGFWNEMNAWAHEHQFDVDLFEGFDEPWKSDVNDRSSNSGGPSGPMGAEGNYGWWKRYDSPTRNFYTYVPKVEELEAVDPAPEGETGQGLATVTVAMVTMIIVGLGITPFILWQLWKAKHKPISKEALLLAQEFRQGLASASALEKVEVNNKTPAISEDQHGTEKCFVFALKFPYDKKYELDKKLFTIDEDCILGQGHYGIVYKGKISSVAEEAAFKTLNSNGSIIELKNLLSEIKIMAYVGKHDHIVNLLGAYTAKIEQGIIYLASEFCSLGSLEKYLRAQRSNFNDGSQKPAQAQATPPQLNYVVAYFQPDTDTSTVIVPQKVLTGSDLLKWAYQIACGMEHLAKKKVIHSDLATRNVLLTSDGTAKICDFGLSRQLYYNSDYLKSSRNEELPWRWMSVESLRSLLFSIESDVWTYGVTLWEIFSLGDLPYPGVPGWTPSFLQELEFNNYRMDGPKHADEEIYGLMKECWGKAPSSRPSFTTLKDKLYEKWEEMQMIE